MLLLNAYMHVWPYSMKLSKDKDLIPMLHIPYERVITTRVNSECFMLVRRNRVKVLIWDSFIFSKFSTKVNCNNYTLDPVQHEYTSHILDTFSIYFWMSNVFKSLSHLSPIYIRSRLYRSKVSVIYQCQRVVEIYAPHWNIALHLYYSSNGFRPTKEHYSSNSGSCWPSIYVRGLPSIHPANYGSQ